MLSLQCDEGIVTCETQYLLHEWQSVVVALGSTGTGSSTFFESQEVCKRAPWTFSYVDALDPPSSTYQQRIPKTVDDSSTLLCHKDSLAPEQDCLWMQISCFPPTEANAFPAVDSKIPALVLVTVVNVSFLLCLFCRVTLTISGSPLSESFAHLALYPTPTISNLRRQAVG